MSALAARLQARRLPGGRLHLNDGPIDLIIAAWGAPAAIEAAYGAAYTCMTGLLDGLCAELPVLRGRAVAPLASPVGRRMGDAVAPYVVAHLLTPMAAVAGAVAEAVLEAMVCAAELDRAYVNNGGDIALHLAPGARLVLGAADRPDRAASLFAAGVLDAASPIRGVATSGWRGRSFSLGIADAVTVLAASAAAADAAATVIANAVDLPELAGIVRVPAEALDPQSDLGPRLVTRSVPPLTQGERVCALASGAALAGELVAAGRIVSAALHLQGATRVVPGGLPALRAA